MPLYRRSQVEDVVYVRRPVDTVTGMAAFGSADGYTVSGTEFGTDETIMVAGNVVATDLADLRGGTVEITVNGPVVGVASWTGFDPVSGYNFWSFTLGALAEGDYTVQASFLRLRV